MNITAAFTQQQWDALIQRYPLGTPVTGMVARREQYGVWVALDELKDVPALLEIIHFQIVESDPEHRIKYPEDYPDVGERIHARILAWCQQPQDVRLTQLSHLDWCHRSSSKGESS